MCQEIKKPHTPLHQVDTQHFLPLSLYSEPPLNPMAAPILTATLGYALIFLEISISRSSNDTMQSQITAISDSQCTSMVTDFGYSPLSSVMCKVHPIYLFTCDLSRINGPTPSAHSGDLCYRYPTSCFLSITCSIVLQLWRGKTACVRPKKWLETPLLASAGSQTTLFLAVCMRLLKGHRSLCNMNTRPALHGWRL